MIKRCEAMRDRAICLIIILSALIALNCGVSRAADNPSPSLPEVSGWSCGEIRVIQLDAVSGNQGYWQERDYVTNDGTAIKATLLYGAGPKFYNQPPAGTSSSNGASTYEVIAINGYKSSLEYDPTLGYSVAVNAFERKFSLTVECGAFESRDEVVKLAGLLMSAIK
jgi:hypothetical protein